MTTYDDTNGLRKLINVLFDVMQREKKYLLRLAICTPYEINR